MLTRLIAQLFRLRRENYCLVVQRNNPGSSQNRLAQPTHAEQQQQDADNDLKRMHRKTAKQWPKGKYDECEERKPRKGTYRCRTPTSDRDDREHDRQCFDRFDKRAQEGRCDRWCRCRPYAHW